MSQHYAVRNTSVTSCSTDNLHLVIIRLVSTHTSSPGAPRHGVSSCTALLSSRHHSCVNISLSGYSLYYPTIIRALVVLSYRQGTRVILSSGHSLCYPTIIRVLIVLSYYHQGTHGVNIPIPSGYSLLSYHQGTHCVILLLSGYLLCYHRTITRVLMELTSPYHQGTHCVASYHQGTHGVIIPYHQGTHCVSILSSGYSWSYHPRTIRVLTVLASYHQGTHGVIPVPSGYSCSYHPRNIRVLTSRYHQDIHGAVSSTAKTSLITVQNRNTRLQTSAAM